MACTFAIVSSDLAKSSAVGAGHVVAGPLEEGCPIEPLSDLWGVHGRSRDIDRPAGVVCTSQIRGDSVEPTIAKRSRNLFSHDDRGPSGVDEAKEVGPQMPFIVGTQLFACERKRLTGTGPRP
jgi:hypothetical protein